jgi:ribosomal protein L2
LSTAQTFTSTRPIGSAILRITSSVMSVGTLEAFFGQLIQIMPAGSSSGSNCLSLASTSARSVTNTCAASIVASADESC